MNRENVNIYLNSTGVNCIILAYGVNANETADRIEAFAFGKDFLVEETIVNEKRVFDKLLHYIREGSISAVLVKNIQDIPISIDEAKTLIKTADEYGVSINEEQNGWNRLEISEEQEDEY